MDQKEEIEALKAALKDVQETCAAYERNIEVVDAMWLELGFILGLNELAYPMDVYAIRRKVAELVDKRDVLQSLEEQNHRYANRNLYSPGDLPVFTQDRVVI